MHVLLSIIPKYIVYYKEMRNYLLFGRVSPLEMGGHGKVCSLAILVWFLLLTKNTKAKIILGRNRLFHLVIPTKSLLTEVSRVYIWRQELK